MYSPLFTYLNLYVQIIQMYSHIRFRIQRYSHYSNAYVQIFSFNIIQFQIFWIYSYIHIIQIHLYSPPIHPTSTPIHNRMPINSSERLPDWKEACLHWILIPRELSWPFLEPMLLFVSLILCPGLHHQVVVLQDHPLLPLLWVHNLLNRRILIIIRLHHRRNWNEKHEVGSTFRVSCVSMRRPRNYSLLRFQTYIHVSNYWPFQVWISLNISEG